MSEIPRPLQICDGGPGDCGGEEVELRPLHLKLDWEGQDRNGDFPVREMQGLNQMKWKNGMDGEVGEVWVAGRR